MPEFKKGRSPAYYTWRRFKRNKLAVFGLTIIIISAIIAILGYQIIPDPTPHSNNMILELETHPPGYKAKILKIHRNSSVHDQNFLDIMISGKESNHRWIPITHHEFKEDYLIVKRYVGIKGTEGMEEKYKIADVLFPLSTSDPEIETKDRIISYTNFEGERKSISFEEAYKKAEKENLIVKTYWLGTDRFGRDMLSRLILGTRVSLSVGTIAVFISLVIGLFIGSIGGFFRGRTDNFVMWLINVVWSVPALLLVIALTMVIGKGFWQVFVAVGLTMWVEIARIVRGQIISIREKEFVEACRALGYRNGRIIVRHILPNILGPVIVICAVNFATAILLEAGLSFLGVGVQPPMPSWGVMINDHFGYIVVDAAYLAILPGIAIMIMVLAFNLLGNGLRDALDVQLK